MAVRWRGRFVALQEDGTVVWEHCARCAQPLMVAESVARGVGPHCARIAEAAERRGRGENLCQLWRERALSDDRRRYREDRRRLEERQRWFNRWGGASRVTPDGFRVDVATGELLGPVIGWGSMSDELRARLIGQSSSR